MNNPGDPVVVQTAKPSRWRDNFVTALLQLIRAGARWLLGIPKDMANTENFMAQVLRSIQGLTAKLQAHITRTDQIGDGVNQVAAHSQDVERLLRHLARGDDRLRRSLQAWDENEERKRKLEAEKPDAGIVNAAGGVIASAGTENVEEAADSVMPKIVEITPIKRVRKPNNN